MNTRTTRTHFAALLLGAAAVPGCVSLDPSADIAEASALVEMRAGTDTGWTLPWDERAGRWDGVAPLSSDTAVRVALQNNRAIRREVETIAATRADLVQAHLLPNPVISVAVGFPTDGLGGDPLAVAFVQQLAWLWRRPAAIDAADADLRRRVLAVSDAALRLVADVRRTHAEVVLAERAVVLQHENIDLVERSVGLLRDRFSVGEASLLDVNRLELDLLRARTTLTDRTADLDTAKRAMLELLARAEEPAAWETDGVLPDVSGASAGLEEIYVIELAATQRLDVAAAGAAFEGRLAELDLTELGRLPEVSAGTRFQKNFSSRPGVFPAVEITPKLFDDNSARVARAASELQQAAIEADRVRQTAVLEVRRAWVAFRAELSTVESYEREILVLARQNLDLARAAFDAGETDLTVFLESQRQVNEASLELNDRRQETIRQLIELERAAGGSLEITS